MAILYNTVRSTNLTTSLGGTIANGDSLNITQGNDQYTAGLDMSAYNLVDVLVGQGFTGNIAPEGASWHFDATGTVTLAWSGQVINLRSDAGGIARLQVRPAAGGRANLTNGPFAILEASGGTTTVLDSADADAVELDQTARVIMAPSASAATQLLVGPSAILDTGRSFVGGSIQGVLAVTAAAAQFTGGLTIRAGGVLRFQDGAGGGGSSTLTLESGAILDLRTAVRPLALQDVVFKPGSRVLRRLNGQTYTVAGSATGTPSVDLV